MHTQIMRKDFTSTVCFIDDTGRTNHENYNVLAIIVPD
jgi:hypothetical protein